MPLAGQMGPPGYNYPHPHGVHVPPLVGTGAAAQVAHIIDPRMYRESPSRLGPLVTYSINVD